MKVETTHRLIDNDGNEVKQGTKIWDLHDRCEAVFEGFTDDSTPCVRLGKLRDASYYGRQAAHLGTEDLGPNVEWYPGQKARLLEMAKAQAEHARGNDILDAAIRTEDIQLLRVVTGQHHHGSGGDLDEEIPF